MNISTYFGYSKPDSPSPTIRRRENLFSVKMGKVPTRRQIFGSLNTKIILMWDY